MKKKLLCLIVMILALPGCEFVKNYPGQEHAGPDWRARYLAADQLHRHVRPEQRGSA